MRCGLDSGQHARAAAAPVQDSYWTLAQQRLIVPGRRAGAGMI